MPNDQTEKVEQVIAELRPYIEQSVGQPGRTDLHLNFGAKRLFRLTYEKRTTQKGETETVERLTKTLL